MADLPSAIFARLITDTEVAAVVGTRVYPEVRPQNSALPAIVYNVPSHFAERDLDGSTSVRMTRVQFNCLAMDAKTAWQLGEKVIAATEDPQTVAGVIFSAGQPEGPFLGNGSDTAAGHIYWTRVDLPVRYRFA